MRLLALPSELRPLVFLDCLTIIAYHGEFVKTFFQKNSGKTKTLPESFCFYVIPAQRRRYTTDSISLFGRLAYRVYHAR